MVTGPASFRATCRTREWVGPRGQLVPRDCDETFEGLEGAAQLAAHMRDVHGKGTPGKAWPFAKEPATLKPFAHKAPPVGRKLDDVVAKWVEAGQLEILS